MACDHCIITYELNWKRDAPSTNKIVEGLILLFEVVDNSSCMMQWAEVGALFSIIVW